METYAMIKRAAVTGIQWPQPFSSVDGEGGDDSDHGNMITKEERSTVGEGVAFVSSSKNSQPAGGDSSGLRNRKK